MLRVGYNGQFLKRPSVKRIEPFHCVIYIIDMNKILISSLSKNEDILIV